MAFLYLGEIDKSLNDLTEAIRLDPSLSVAYGNRGNVYDRLERFEEALQDYDRAIELDPENALGHRNRAGTLLALNQAIHVDPGLAEAYVKRAAAYTMVGDLDTALNDYDEATSINSGYIEVYLGRGSLHDRLGDL